MTRRRTVGVVTVLAIAMSGLITVITYQRLANPDIKGSVVAFEVLNDRDVSVTINVTRKNPSQVGSCIVRARSSDGAETGRREIVIPPAETRTVQVKTIVRAYRQPFVGDIYGCGTDIPGYLIIP